MHSSSSPHSIILSAQVTPNHWATDLSAQRTHPPGVTHSEDTSVPSDRAWRSAEHMAVNSLLGPQTLYEDRVHRRYLSKF